MSKKINIKIEELVQLKSQGMAYYEIAEYFVKKGKKISTGTVYNRLKEYYELQGIEKPKRKNKINIDTSEIVELKKEGMSCEEIAKYFTEKGKKISTKSIYIRLEKYYESQGEEKQDEISDIELAELKEKGMSDKAIAEYFTQKEKKISTSAVYNRLKKYYELQGKPKPRTRTKRKTKNKVDIDTSEIVQLKSQGMAYDEIAKYFTEKGKKISTGTVYNRLKEYYELQGIQKPKRKNKINIATSEIVELKKEGMSCEEIAKYFTEKGKKISTKSIYRRLEKYCEEQGIEKIKTKRKPRMKKNKIDIDTREIVQLKEQGMSDKEIAEHFTKIGKKISRTTIIYRLKKYYEEQNIEKIKCNKKSKEYDDEVKEILMNGMTVEEYISEYEIKENKEYIKKKIEKLSIVAEYSKKENGEFKPDNDFIEVLDILENSTENINKYKKQLKKCLSDAKSEKDTIESIKSEIFNGNSDLMVYTLIRFNTSFYEEKDKKNFNLLRNKYEEKIDEYLRRLEIVENSRKNKKEQKEKVNFKKQEKEFDE